MTPTQQTTVLDAIAIAADLHERLAALGIGNPMEEATIQIAAEKAVDHVIAYLTSLPPRVGFRAQSLLFSPSEHTYG